MIIEINVRNGRELIRAFRQLPASTKNEVDTEMRSVGDDLISYIQESKLSGQVLNRKSGMLANSLNTQLKVNIVNVRLDVTANTPYAAIHEMGGQTGPHTITATKATLLRFIGRDGTIQYRKSVNHPGSHIPERSYLRSAMLDKADEIKNRIKDAMMRGVQKELGAVGDF